MAIGVMWQPEIDRSTYDQLREVLIEPGRAAGLRFHAAGEAEGGGWRVFEIWDSREGLERFIAESLRPVVEQASGGAAPAPEPTDIFEVHFQTP
jgi:hypothetical protein